MIKNSLGQITVEVQKLVNGGQGLGFHEGKPVFAWNALPGESVQVSLTKKKNDYSEGVAVRIINSSPLRIDPEEDHFLSCSPWQIMNYASENESKKEVAKETFRKIGCLEITDPEIVYSTEFGYRNKIEYGFLVDESNGCVRLGLNKRGSNELYPINKCLLAKEKINKAAIEILELLNNEKQYLRYLKKIIIRENTKGKVVASLFVTDEKFKLSGDFAGLTGNVLSGFQVYFLNDKTRSPLKVKPLYSYGNNFIVEEIAGKVFKCNPLLFFQVNVSVFEKTLSRINTFITDNEEIVDFYSGTGSIGISLGNKVKSCVLVEVDKEASKLAKENIVLNGLDNFTAKTGSSENMLNEITKDKTIIFDPPRAGLHPKVVDKVLDVLPGKMIYLSCDVATQARDIKKLSQNYSVKFCELYNYFPRTPHVESLIVLEKK